MNTSHFLQAEQEGGRSLERELSRERLERELGVGEKADQGGMRRELIRG